MNKPNGLRLLSIAFIASALFTSCKKNESLSPTPPDQEAAVMLNQNPGGFEKSCIEITPERTQEIEMFNASAARGASTTENYRNFTIKWGTSVPAKIVALVKTDIDRIFTSGVTTATITKMQGAIINVFNGGTSGNLYYTNGNVYITSFSMYKTYAQNQNPVGPVIFHELTHYYHDKQLSGGFNNTTVKNLYNAAKSNHAYPAGEYVLTNPAEYLATSNEAYFPSTFRVPYNKANVTQKDAGGAQFLSTTF